MPIECSIVKDRLFGARTYRGAIKITLPGKGTVEKIAATHRLTRALALEDAFSMKRKEEIWEK